MLRGDDGKQSEEDLRRGGQLGQGVLKSWERPGWHTPTTSDEAMKRRHCQYEGRNVHCNPCCRAL